MEALIAIDPGKTTGWALFMGGKLCVAAPSVQSASIAGPFEVIIELPRIYPGGGKGDPNDIVDLAVLVGKFAERYKSGTVHLVTPRQWKGNVPKKIHQPRILKKLSPEELAVMPKRPRAKDYDHNMVDAVGLGLFHLGR